MKKEEVATLIKTFLDDSCGEWDWDDFLSVKQKDPEIEKIRLFCAQISDLFPPTKNGEYCNEEGTLALQNFAQALEVGNWEKDIATLNLKMKQLQPTKKIRFLKIVILSLFALFVLLYFLLNTKELGDVHKIIK